ncbi:hypothetical protein RRV45_14485 [Bacillus sp. DTU_2020_1000418_1_SI_GHA_SEK_038]|uniref:hypothetical protein n=1 Tax=Bacillus sp. DTU_2020_1000418_1_SI_GHA_SEK_038 TaxID=3077585 RepID=UPI0028F0F121|nr:hypothetical protein [Bacillus sp. DTU_2020_1000418_1_SI_GHA_SEK_038]WNS74121.1 hypothetical protein RRV45_14485 [Bacillus sp. DTU_2020_1000418_1_SI_GHA_SEK_038]
MKLKWITSLLFVVLLFSACSGATMDQVIEEDIPFNVIEVIHKEKVKDGVVLLYVTKQKSGREPIDAVTVAFLKGNDRDGWGNAGHNHWEHEENDWMTVYKDVFYEYNHRGNLENRLPVIYGKVVREDIQSVVVYGENGKLENAPIFEKEGGRYYLKLGDYEMARGIVKNNSK